MNLPGRPVWKVPRLGRISALSGKEFPPDHPIVAALFGERGEEDEESSVRGAGFVRRDYFAEEATPETLAGAYCVWRTRTPPASPPSGKLDLGLARALLERLLEEGDAEKGPVCLTLALLLIRRRRLHLVGEAKGLLRVRWPKTQLVFEIPAPVLGDAEATALEQDFHRLFGR